MTANVQQQEEALTNLLISRWEQASQKIEHLAAELPENRYDWRPRADVRSCAEIIRHVAFWNHYVADTLRGGHPDGEANELPAASFPSKPQILDALHRSSEDVKTALRQNPDAEQLLPFLEHTSEHYGQFAVYARLLDITPPASRS